MDSSTPFRFLDIPLEMRNRVYDFSLAAEDAGGNEVDICHAAPPSKALFSTCKQIHGEASGLYRQALRDYWTTNTFVLDRRTHVNMTAEDKARIMSINTEDPLHMQSLQIIVDLSFLLPEVSYFTWTFSPTEAHGVWEHSFEDSPSPTMTGSRSHGHIAVLRRDANDIDALRDNSFGDGPLRASEEETKDFCEQNVDRVLTFNEQIVELSDRVDAMLLRTGET